MALVCALDAGTSYVKLIVFKSGTKQLIAKKIVTLDVIYPQDGWVEFDPMELLYSIEYCMSNCLKQMKNRYTVDDILAMGIANQRETTLVWDKITGMPLHNAILWLDNRTSGIVDKLISDQPVNGNKYYFQTKTGLPICNFFSAVKLKWLIENVPSVKKAIDQKRCLFGTLDTWLLWNLLDKVHATDVTNASRTLLMNIQTLQWDEEMLSFFNIPTELLPKIKSNAEMYGYIPKGHFKGVPITGCIADQQASLIGQMCLNKDDVKATYGTGCFILYNTGPVTCFSNNGLLTTVGYQIGKNPAQYALEGAIAIGGEAFRRLRDELDILSDYSELDYMAQNASELDEIVYFTTMHELFAINWQKQKRGMLRGCSSYTNHNNIVRAAMETLCFLVIDVIKTMEKDIGSRILCLKVDGLTSTNIYIMQMQADFGGFEILRSKITENSCLGAAQIAIWGINKDVEIKDICCEPPQLLTPKGDDKTRDAKYKKWKKTVMGYNNWFG